MNMIRGIKIDNLIKAQSQFEEYRCNISKPQERAGAIGAFEYTYEICWKMIKKLLEVEGVKEVYTPKDCFREGTKFGLIADSKIRSEYLEIRHI